MLWKNENNTIRMQGFKMPRKNKKIIRQGFVFNGDTLNEEVKCILKRDRWKTKEIESLGETMYFTLKRSAAERTAKALKMEIVYPEMSLIWTLEKGDIQ